MAFGRAREILEQAQRRSDDQLQRWRANLEGQGKERESLLNDFNNFFKLQTQRTVSLLQDQALEREGLLRAVKESQETAKALVGNLDYVVSGLQKMVKAVEEAGFPSRLDNIQTLVTTSQAAIQSLHTRIDTLEKHLEGQVKLLAAELQRSSSALQDKVESCSLAAKDAMLERLSTVGQQIGESVGQKAEELDASIEEAAKRLKLVVGESEASALSSRREIAETTMARLAELERKQKNSTLLVASIAALSLLAGIATAIMLFNG